MLLSLSSVIPRRLYVLGPRTAESCWLFHPIRQGSLRWTIPRMATNPVAVNLKTFLGTAFPVVRYYNSPSSATGIKHPYPGHKNNIFPCTAYARIKLWTAYTMRDCSRHALFRPFRAFYFPPFTPGLCPGLYSCAASRLKMPIKHRPRNISDIKRNPKGTIHG